MLILIMKIIRELSKIILNLKALMRIKLQLKVVLLARIILIIRIKNKQKTKQKIFL